MRPIELVLEGFRSYDARTVFDWRGRQLVGVVGPIGSGKSSILDAIAFALYGKTPVFERENKTLIREGRDAARVELAFEVDGQPWRVVRVIRRRGASQHALYRLPQTAADSDDALIPIPECERERQVTERIEKLLGLDFQAFCRSVLLAQNRFAELLNASPGDRDKVLKGVFGLDRLDAMHRLARDRRQRAELDQRELSGRLGNVEDDRRRLAEARQDQSASEKTVARLEAWAATIAELEQRREKTQRALNESEERLRLLAELADQLPRQAAVTSLLTRLETTAAALGEAEEAWKAARAEIEKREKSVRATVAELGGSEALARAEQELTGVEQARKLLARRQEAYAQAPREVEERQRDVDRARQASATAKEHLARATAEARQRADALTAARRELAERGHEGSRRATLVQARERLEKLEEGRRELDRQRRLEEQQGEKLALAEQQLAAARQEKTTAEAAESEAQRQVEQAAERLARAEEAYHLAHRENLALSLVARLEEGQPCPVCEQLVEVLPSFRLFATLDEAQAHRDRARWTKEQADHRLLELSRQTATRRETARGAERTVDEAREAAALLAAENAKSSTLGDELACELTEQLGSTDFATTLAATEELLSRLEARVLKDELAQRQAELARKDAEHAAALASQKEESAAGALATATEKASRAEAELAEAREAVDKGRRNLLEILGEGDPAKLLETARQRLSASEDALDQARRDERRQAVEVERRRFAADSARHEPERLSNRLAGLAGQLGHVITDAGGTLTLRELERLVRDELTAAQRQAEVERQRTAEALRVIHQTRREIDAEIELTNSADFTVVLNAARSERDRATATVAELERRLAEAAEIEDRLAVATRRYQLYHRLADDLTAPRFLRYLLDEERARLAALGSERFEMLSGGRYRFSTDGTFQVIDLANAEAVRKSETLSGGETFLASLALALALAEKVTGGGGRLDAFFLDEGFGSLDEEHFELAMEGIERLVTDSPQRLVTVVSHMPEMRERIDDLIVLDKAPADGSTIVRQGASADRSMSSARENDALSLDT